MTRFASRLIIWLLVVVVVIFTATRIIDFLSICFPASQRWMAWPALVCFDLGTIAWLFFATAGAEGIPQRVLAYGMVIIDLVGVSVATTGDMLLYAEQHGAVSQASLPAGFQTVAIIATVLVIILNFAGLVFVHLADPGHFRRAAIQNARDHVHQSTLAAIQSQAHAVAPHVARELAERWVRDLFSESLIPAPSHSFRSDEFERRNGHQAPTRRLRDEEESEGPAWAAED